MRGRKVLLAIVATACFETTSLYAQVSVTPTIMPAPAGQAIVVNNGPGDQSDPHVSGNVVSYSNSGNNGFTVHYFDLAVLTDSQIPNAGAIDLLSDVRGSVVAFTRVSPGGSEIFSFDTSATNAPVEIAPVAAPSRQTAQIGDRTIAWQDFGFSSTGGAAIVAYDRVAGTTTRVTPLSAGDALEQFPGISPDGTVLVYERCANISAPCSVWKATLANGNWTVQQVLSAVGGNQSHPDTDASTIVYSADTGSGGELVWQPVGGGTEHVLNLAGGTADVPAISNGVVSFMYLAPGASVHQIAVYDIAANVLYLIPQNPASIALSDAQLNDVSVTPGGQVTVVWQAQDADLNVYAYTFNLPSVYSVCLLYDPTKSVKSGAAYPIKIELCDGSGNDLSSSSIVVHATSLTQVSTSASATVTDTGNANPDNDFRFDSTLGTSGGYVFNLSTKGLAGTYLLNFTAGGDSTTHSVQFQVHP